MHSPVKCDITRLANCRQTLPIHVSGQRDFVLVSAVADLASVLAVILDNDVLDHQVRADYLVVFPANEKAICSHLLKS